MASKNEEYNKKIILTLVATATIWVSTILISVFSPELISGSQQEHLPIVLWTAWIWGIIATIITLRMIRESFNFNTHMILNIAIIIIWIIVTILGVFAPPLVTGSDPTSLPIFSIGAPILGMLFTYSVLFLGRPPSK